MIVAGGINEHTEKVTILVVTFLQCLFLLDVFV
jgi:hypothetical protein